jgi:hypothetical protein
MIILLMRALWVKMGVGDDGGEVRGDGEERVEKGGRERTWEVVVVVVRMGGCTGDEGGVGVSDSVFPSLTSHSLCVLCGWLLSAVCLLCWALCLSVRSVGLSLALRDLRGTRLQGDHRKGRRRRGRITRVKRRGALAPKREGSRAGTPRYFYHDVKTRLIISIIPGTGLRIPATFYCSFTAYLGSPSSVGLQPIYGRRTGHIIYRHNTLVFSDKRRQ